jgi:hypothetical protein
VLEGDEGKEFAQTAIIGPQGRSLKKSVLK